MAYTPKKSVHWDMAHPSPSEFSSPSIGNDTSDSFCSTSSLEYVNSQLIAHGFVPAPGLCLDGVSNKDSERVVKCLMSLLSQRMEDMSRTEDLSTKLRTLSYDHQRLTSMHQTALDNAANAEREMNLHKSKLTATQRTLQNAEAAHKQTSLELQRTKSSLQGIRTAHQQELKKKEKEIDKLAEKWQKLADSQAKLSTTASGISCANVAAIEGRTNQIKGPDFLEVALDEAEKARAALVEDNKHLKMLVLKAVNSIQRILYQTKALLVEPTEPPPYPFTTTTLFPIASITTPNEKLSTLLSDLRDNLETVSERLVAPPLPSTSSDEKPTKPKASNDEVQRLRATIASLKDEIAEYQQQLETQSEEMQTLLDTIAAQQRNSADQLGEISMELNNPLQDEERERLEKIRQELEQEEEKLQAAAAKLRAEKAGLEAQRMKFLDEKQAWEMEKASAVVLVEPDPEPEPEFEPEPEPEYVPASPPRRHKVAKAAFKPPKKSPRKSPAKFVAKVGSSKGHRPKRSLSSPSKVIPAFETEVLPSFARLSTLAPPTSLLPGAFVLPPPSPHASLPSQPALPPPAPISPPDFGDIKTQYDDNPLAPVGQPEPERSHTPTTPEPPKRAFPVAKPFAQRMVHAYSPAKPSPLSRILMLADTPPGVPELPELSIVSEEEDVLGGADSDSPVSEPPLTLAQELGVSESPPDVPLQERKEANVAQAPTRTTMKGRALFPDARKPAVSTRDKGKSRAGTATFATSSTTQRKTSGTLEKENDRDAKKGKGGGGKISPVFKAPSTKESTSRSSAGKTAGASKTAKPTASSAAKASAAGSVRTSSAKPMSSVGGGPRRVMLDSAEAPPVARSRRT
ncbi:hypothetical protein CC1G_00777 [Coprinopsis cinerea okayama7|uniref:Afadin and alpha-actinin-binding-domain-containing protein n=1 Tax=Coprinopsis cinerea (strain Okayama-7 / 130 / ATCC MYA-4618 / FGSC 9003) TaxID=240176 RepID=A8N8Q2_COPC7|nr:hypothetical protein CC1G_00777 [Coprinopsis cinerea okayama7\|eukprot:XP_001831230.2 hypothetical protein CC1G_00777 [Coprinopsis cinerea okayama7\